MWGRHTAAEQVKDEKSAVLKAKCWGPLQPGYSVTTTPDFSAAEKC